MSNGLDYIERVRERTKDPLFWVSHKRKALAAVQSFFDDHDNEELAERLLEKLERARREYGDNFAGYDRPFIQSQLEEEMIDLVGWTEAGEFAQERGLA